MCEFNWDLIIKGAGLFVTILAVIIAYFFTKRNMRNETIERIGRFKNEKTLESGMAFWGLLAYLTPTENRYSIIVWKQKKGDSEKEYFFRQNQAREFMEKLTEINYEKGLGLFLSKKTRDLFYEYKNILFGFLLAEKNNPDEKILVTNIAMVTSMHNMYQEMVNSLRKEMEPGNNTLNRTRKREKFRKH